MSEDSGGVDGFFRNIDIRSSRQQVHALVNTLEDGIVRLDASGTVLAVNDAIVELTGYPREELLGRPISALLANEADDRMLTAIRSMPDDEDAATVDLVVTTATGDLVPCTLHASPIWNDDEIQGSMCVVQTATDHVGSERPERNTDPSRTLSSAAQYEAIVEDALDAADIGVFVLDDDFEIAWLNETTEEYFGLDREAVLGHDTRTVIADHMRDVVTDGERFADTLLDTYENDEYVEEFKCRIEPAEDRNERWLVHQSMPIDTGQYAGGRVELYYDITDQKRTEHSLRESEDRFRSLVEAVEEYAIFMLDPDGYVVSWNDGAHRIKGYTEDEILGTHFSAFYTDAAVVTGVPEQNLSEAAATGSVEDEGWRLRKDGSQFWANVTITAIRDDDGDITGYAKVTRDMTDRRDYEETLRRQRDVTRRILETAPVGVLTVEEDGTFTTANQRAAELLDLEGGADGVYPVGVNAVYDEDGEFLPPDERPYVQVFETGEPVRNWHAQLELSNGKRWLSTNIEPMVDETGDIKRALVTIQDISQLKDQADRLQRQRDDLESELEEIFERVDDGFYALDDDLRFTYVNDRADDLLGVDKGELLGAIIWETVPEIVGTEFEERYREAWETQEPVSFEAHHSPHDAWYEVHVYPSEDGLSVYFRDITERKGRERELRETKARLEVATEAGAVGTWAWHVPQDRLVTSAWFAEMFGVDPDAAHEGISLDEFMAAIHDDDRDRVEAAIEAAVSSCGEYEEEYRIWNADDELRWVVARGRVECDDDGNPVTFPGALTDITDQKRAEIELERQRDQLAALNSLNEVVREITDAVISQSTREEIEQIACDALAAADAYEFAWLAAVDSTTDTVEPRATAGTRGYVDEITILMDSDDPTSEGPGATAIREQETQVVQDVFTNPAFEPWRDAAAEYGFSAVASIPIVHEGAVYGVLGVYADRKNAFDTSERRIINQLGELVGHAIAAVERKQALMSDEATEIALRLRDVFDAYDVPAIDGPISFDRVVSVDENTHLMYGSAATDAMETLEALGDEIGHWTAVSVSEGADGMVRFEVEVSQSPLAATVASHGGTVETAEIEDGDFDVTIQLPREADVRRVIEAIKENYPNVEPLARRQVERSDDPSRRATRTLLERLTDRQRTILEMAYYGGFYEWPRERSGADLADQLDISPATFSQHRRAAHRRLFEGIFDDVPATG